MAVKLRYGYSSAHTSGNTQVAVLLNPSSSSALRVGDYLVIFFVGIGQITPPAGWTQLWATQGATGYESCYAKFLTAADISAGTAYFTSTTTSGTGYMTMNFSGVDQTTPTESLTAQTNASGTTFTAPSATPTVPNSMLLSTVAMWGNSGPSPALAGMTDAAQGSNFMYNQAGGAAGVLPLGVEGVAPGTHTTAANGTAYTSRTTSIILRAAATVLPPSVRYSVAAHNGTSLTSVGWGTTYSAKGYLAIGDLMIAQIARYNSTAAPSSIPPGWTLYRTETRDATNGGIAVTLFTFYKVATASDIGANPQFGWATSILTSDWMFYIDEVDVLNPILTSSGVISTASNTAAVVIPAVTTAIDNALLIATVTNSNPQAAPAVPAGWTGVGTMNNPPAFQTYRKTQTPAGNTGTVTVTETTAGNFAATMIAIAPQSAPAAPTGLAPTGGAAVDRSDPKRLTWNPGTAPTQGGFDLRWRLGAGAWNNVSFPTTSAFWDAVYYAFPAGSIEWQVRTYDPYMGTSAWSASSFFTAADGTPGLKTKVGSFAKGAAGVQAITGLGFRPKAIIFWWAVSRGAPGTWTADIYGGIGFTTGPTNSCAQAHSSRSGLATSLTERRMVTKAITQVDGNGNFHEADLTSMDADGFTLTWGTDTSGVPVTVNFLAIGGADITNAKVINWLGLSAPGLKAVTGVGFTPDLVLHGPTAENPAMGSLVNGLHNFGAMNKHGQQCANALVAQNGSGANTSRYQQTDACLVSGWVNETITHQAHFVSMDADGFSIYFSNSNTTSDQMFSLCLKGLSSKVGALAKTTAAGPSTQDITHVGFTPKAILAGNISNSAMQVPFTHWFHSMGATDGTNQRAIATQDFDASNPTLVQSICITDGFIIPRTAGTPAILAKGSVTATGNDGFTVTWNPTTTDLNEEVIYIAIGDAGKDTYPAKVA